MSDGWSISVLAKNGKGDSKAQRAEQNKTSALFCLGARPVQVPVGSCLIASQRADLRLRFARLTTPHPSARRYTERSTCFINRTVVSSRSCHSFVISSPPPMTKRQQPHRRKRPSLRRFTIRLPRPMRVEIVSYYKFQLRSCVRVCPEFQMPASTAVTLPASSPLTPSTCCLLPAAACCWRIPASRSC